MFDIILAHDLSNGIGKDNKLPWEIKEDMDYFKNKTMYSEYPNYKNVVIMGYNTWISIPKQFRPLKNRINIIISKNHQDQIIANNDIHLAEDFDKALEIAYHLNDINNIYVIGGKQIYDTAFLHNDFRYLHSTQINNDYNCDVKLEINLKNLELCNQTQTYKCNDKLNKIDTEIVFKTFRRIDHPENNYLELMHKIINKGDERQTRNAVTLSLFGEQLKFNISEVFPLLTTKKMFWKGIVEELLFFLRGDTNSKKLSDKGVKIWNPNTTREFLDNLGLESYAVGDMGPMYGYQWRTFNKPYKSEDESGYDQLQNCINLIKNNPTNRRILMTAYNPLQLNESVLAPCHSIVVQFYVNDGKLSCHMYQRSADTFLGLPFNIASTSLLTYIIANVTDLNPGNIIISLGDTHLYKNHVDAAKEQLLRTPYQFPKLKINKNLKNIEDIENLQFNDFELIDYKYHPTIKAKMIA